MHYKTPTVPKKVSGLITRGHLIDTLENWNVRWHNWVPGTNRTIEDLVEKLNYERMYLVHENGITSLHCTVCVIYIRYHHNGTWLVLREKCQRNCRTGNVFTRPIFDGIAETIKICDPEHILLTAKRGLFEELPSFAPRHYHLEHRKECEVIHTSSDKWPGLMAVFYRHKVDCFIRPSLFDPQGYITKEKDWITEFVWIPDTA